MARINETEVTRSLFSIFHQFRADEVIPFAELAIALDCDIPRARKVVEDHISFEVGYETLHFIVLDEQELPPDGGILLMDSMPVFSRPLRLAASELQALLAALEFAESDARSPLCEKLLSVAQSTEGDAAAAGAGAAREADETDGSRRAVYIADGDEEQDILATLAFCREKRRLVEIEYLRSGDTAPETRLVEPHELYLSGEGDWYLDAYCRTKKAFRTFKIARIQSTEAQGGHFEPREHPAEAGTAGVAIDLDEAPCALVRVPADFVVNEHKWPQAEEVAAPETGGSKCLRVPYVGYGWIARRIASQLGCAEVLDPPEVAEAARDFAASVLADYEA